MHHFRNSQKCKIVECGLYVDEQASPKTCLELKCSYSINYTTPHDPNMKLPYVSRKDDDIKLNRNHRYRQCQMQLAVTGMLSIGIILKVRLQISTSITYNHFTCESYFSV